MDVRLAAANQMRRPTRTRLSFDVKARFPAKLYSVASDGFLITWNPDGTSIFVEENLFEEKVMQSYPGFVQIASFLNFRRLFREYSFSWRVVEGTDSLFEFSHSAFLRHRPDLLGEVTTKRKSAQRRLVTALPATARFTSDACGKRGYRRRCRAKSVSDSNSDTISEHRGDSSPNRTSTRSGSDSSQTSSVHDQAQQPTDFVPELYSSTHVLNTIDASNRCMYSTDHHYRPDLLNILGMFVKNELTEEEHLQLLANAAASVNEPSLLINGTRDSTSSQSVRCLMEQESVPFNTISCRSSGGIAVQNISENCNQPHMTAFNQTFQLYGEDVNAVSQKNGKCSRVEIADDGERNEYRSRFRSTGKDQAYEIIDHDGKSLCELKPRVCNQTDVYQWAHQHQAMSSFPGNPELEYGRQTGCMSQPLVDGSSPLCHELTCAPLLDSAVL